MFKEVGRQKNRNTSDHSYIISYKAGGVFFSPKASQIIGLKEKETYLVFCQKEESPTEWYVKVAQKTNNKAVLFGKNSKVNSSTFRKEFISSMEISKFYMKSIKLDLIEEPLIYKGEKYYKIDTQNIELKDTNV